MIKIFDLDGTVIDSSHRQTRSKGGTLSLSSWKRNSTPEMIALDKLLPLAKQMRLHYDKGQITLVCTAREMALEDYYYLGSNGLFAHAILSRPSGNDAPDAPLKIALLHDWAKKHGYTWERFCSTAIMYDDNVSVINSLTFRGLRCYNSTILNRELAQ